MHIYTWLFLILLFDCPFSNLRQFVAIQYDMIVNHLLILSSLFFLAFLSFPMPKPSWIFICFPTICSIRAPVSFCLPIQLLETCLLFYHLLGSFLGYPKTTFKDVDVFYFSFVAFCRDKTHQILFPIFLGGMHYSLIWSESRRVAVNVNVCLFSRSEEQREKGKERRVEMFFLS